MRSKGFRDVAGPVASQDLIGVPGSRALIDTPALILDLDVLMANIRAMADFGARTGLDLRPHAKTHKSGEIGAMQLEAGAVGLCCAKLGEAEALASQGLGPLLITTPAVGPGALARLAALAERSEGLALVVDEPGNVAAIVAALDGRRLTLFVDIDPGQHRTGVADTAAAVALARAIAAHPNLRFGGVQFFSGPSQHIEDYDARRADVASRTDRLAAVVDALHSAGMPPPVVTGGGTGTHVMDAELGVMTELQVGSYVFMDDQYSACALYPGAPNPFATALTVATRVISANWPGLATVDAGYKATTGSAVPPLILAGAPAGSRYEYRGDEHGVILVPDGADAPAIGDLVTLATPHCDPTVNLHDFYHVVRGDTLIDIWPVTARGRSA